MNWLWPLRGCLDLLIRPALWKHVLAASWVANIIIVIVAVGSLLWYWPWDEDEGLQWRDLSSWALTVAGTFILVVPLIRGRAGRAVIAPFLDEHGRSIAVVGRGLVGKLGYMIRSLPLRVLWILATIGAVVLHPTVGILVGALAVGHLTALDALDQALLACGVEDKDERARLRGSTFGAVLIAGAVAGGLFVLATLSVFGCLIWVPAMFLGAARQAHGLAPAGAAVAAAPTDSQPVEQAAEAAGPDQVEPTDVQTGPVREQDGA